MQEDRRDAQWVAHGFPEELVSVADIEHAGVVRLYRWIEISHPAILHEVPADALTTTSLVESFEDRDAFVASGMEEGVREGYERLEELLAR